MISGREMRMLENGARSELNSCLSHHKLRNTFTVINTDSWLDLTQTKRRPALVIAGLQGEDLILCQITSRLIRDQYAIAIESEDFESGTLRQSSNARPNRLFTAEQQIVLYKVGRLLSSNVALP